MGSGSVLPYTTGVTALGVGPGQLREFADSAENRCFVCGPGNSSGLHLRFTGDSRRVRGRFVAAKWHEGWEGTVHGGILAAVLDEAMAYLLFLAGCRAVTARLEVRFRRSVVAGDELWAEGQVVRDARRIADLESRLVRGSEVIAEARGRFMKLGPLGDRTFGVGGENDAGSA